MLVYTENIPVILHRKWVAIVAFEREMVGLGQKTHFLLYILLN